MISRDPAAESTVPEELIAIGQSIGLDLDVTTHNAVTIDLSTRSKSLGDGLS